MDSVMQGSRPPDCLAVAGSSKSFTATNLCEPQQTDGEYTCVTFFKQTFLVSVESNIK